jgi:hypothetical protein
MGELWIHFRLGCISRLPVWRSLFLPPARLVLAFVTLEIIRLRSCDQLTGGILLALLSHVYLMRVSSLVFLLQNRLSGCRMRKR